MAKPNPYKKEQVIFLATPSDKDRLYVAAEEEELSVSELCRALVKSGLDARDRKRAKL